MGMLCAWYCLATEIACMLVAAGNCGLAGVHCAYYLHYQLFAKSEILLINSS